MPHHVSSTCIGEVCGACLPAQVQATHKLGEEIAHDDPSPSRHNLTAYVCCKHFVLILGKAAGCFVPCRTKLVHVPPVIGYAEDKVKRPDRPCVLEEGHAGDHDLGPYEHEKLKAKEAGDGVEEL